jgi:hypothetical protein
MTQILAFSGKKGSGKNTLCNFLHGYQLKSFGIIDEFEITDEGELVIETLVRDEQGKEKKGKGLVDITRTDIEFAMWAMDNVWPFVKHYAFATSLKEILIGLFDIPKDMVYGTDEQKDQFTQYKWENMPVKVKGKSGFMTGREFMQYFGTDICREMYSDIWINRTLKDIAQEESKFSIISDARFENEIEAVQKAGGKVIRLTRSVKGKDIHKSELALDNYNGFDAIIDNQNMTIEESCKHLVQLIDEWGWMSKENIAPIREISTTGKRQSTATIK